jgi:hypothetical protein
MMLRSSRAVPGAGLAALVLAGGSAAAQSVHGETFAVAASNAEVDDTRQARGLGFGVSGRLDYSRFRFEARVQHAALKADFSIQPDYHLDQLDLAVSWFWRPFLALQLGFARRFVNPDLVAQDLGLLRAGVSSETRIARVAAISVRGAWLPLTRFSGGGDGGPGLEVGIGASVGATDARVQGFVAYDYTRIDRETGFGPAPLQYSIGRAGVSVRIH